MIYDHWLQYWPIDVFLLLYFFYTHFSLVILLFMHFSCVQCTFLFMQTIFQSVIAFFFLLSYDRDGSIIKIIDYKIQDKQVIVLNIEFTESPTATTTMLMLDQWTSDNNWNETHSNKRYVPAACWCFIFTLFKLLIQA